MAGVHKTVLIPAANSAGDCSRPIFSNVITWIKQLDKLEFVAHIFIAEKG